MLTARPPQLETPFAVFNEGLLTPNDAFFVRYHWSGLPLSRLTKRRLAKSLPEPVLRYRSNFNAGSSSSNSMRTRMRQGLHFDVESHRPSAANNRTLSRRDYVPPRRRPKCGARHT